MIQQRLSSLGEICFEDVLKYDVLPDIGVLVKNFANNCEGALHKFYSAFVSCSERYMEVLNWKVFTNSAGSCKKWDVDPIYAASYRCNRDRRTGSQAYSLLERRSGVWCH
jgi:hypothetical protein